MPKAPDHLILSGTGKRLEGKDLKGARDSLQELVLLDTTWCCYCCYAGCGIDGLDLPCCFCIGEVCCLGGTCKATSCWDQDGCFSTTSKCCCHIIGFEFPIDNTPGVGVGPVRCCSNLEGRTLEDCKSQAAKDELDTYQKTCWCLACYFCFEGFTYDISPLCDQQGKCCCLWTQIGSASLCDDGCIEYDSKCCCCVMDASIPAGYTPGIVCCGKTLCCAKMPERKEGAPAEQTALVPEPKPVVMEPAPVVLETKVCEKCNGTGKVLNTERRCDCPLGLFPGPQVPVKVTIRSASNLRNADWVGKSDPYCLVEVASKPNPTLDDGKPDPRFATKVVNNELNPVWEHDVELGHWCVGEALKFTVKDSDLIKGDDLLGEVTLDCAQFFESAFEGELKLEGPGKNEKETALIKVRVEVLQPQITVGIVCARGLRNADWVGKSDPYCVCEVVNREKAKIQTKSITDELAPVWNFFGLLPDYHAEETLTFTVKDSDPLKPDDFLGKFKLTYDQFLPNGFSGEVRLSDAGQGCEAYLTLDIGVSAKPQEAQAVQEDQAEQALLPPLQDQDLNLDSGSNENMSPMQEDVLDTKAAPTGLCC